MVLMIATALAVAFVVNSCKRKLAEAEDLSLASFPVRSIDSMFAVQSKSGKISMRIEAPRMESFETDTSTYDFFPHGIEIYAYLEDGRLETIVFSDKARHIISKKAGNPEIWQAFGNVMIKNVIKRETMTTDTLYWDQGRKEIWTDCYVRMESPDGLLQGYGMVSDDRARNATLNKPFNGFAVTEKDSTLVVIDSVNFIGPFKKK